MCGGEKEGGERTCVAETRETAGLLLCGCAKRRTEAWKGKEGGRETPIWSCMEGGRTGLAGFAAARLA